MSFKGHLHWRLKCCTQHNKKKIYIKCYILHFFAENLFTWHLVRRNPVKPWYNILVRRGFPKTFAEPSRINKTRSNLAVNGIFQVNICKHKVKNNNSFGAKWLNKTTSIRMHEFGKSTIVGFHMTSLKFKLKNYRSYWDFTFMMHKSSWKLIFIQIFPSKGFLVLW